MDESAFLHHIFEQTEIILDILSKTNCDEFLQNTMYQYTVIRALEIIGEASKHISEETREKYPEIPFKDMAGLRDRLIHGYFSVDPLLVFGIAEGDVPELHEQLMKIL